MSLRVLYTIPDLYVTLTNYNHFGDVLRYPKYLIYMRFRPNRTGGNENISSFNNCKEQ